MSNPIVRITMLQVLIVVLFLAMLPLARGEGVDDGRTVPCIPDVERATAALGQKRDEAFIAYLHQTGDKYVRNRDFACLYDMLSAFNPENYNRREAKLLLVYRIIAQLGKSNPIGAMIEYEWLRELGGLEKGSDFALLLNNRLDFVSRPLVEAFRKDADRYHHMVGLQVGRPSDSSPLLHYLVSQAAKRIAIDDHLTLQRCLETIDPRQLNPAEQLYFYAVDVLVNLKLNRIAEAYAADMQYRALTATYPDLVITEKRKRDHKVLPSATISPLTRFFTITRETLEGQFTDICRHRESLCGVSPEFFHPTTDPFDVDALIAAMARLETNRLNGNACMTAYWCMKRNLEPLVLRGKEVSPETVDQRLWERFLLARANLMLGDAETAHRQLWALTRTRAINDAPFAAQARAMLVESQETLRLQREATFKDKLVAFSETFYANARSRLLGIASLGLGLVFVFAFWHQFFKQSGHNTLALIQIATKIPVLKKPAERFIEWLYQSDFPGAATNPIFSKIELKRICERESKADTVKFCAANSSDLITRLSRLAPYPLWLIARLPGYRNHRYVLYYMACGASVALLASWAFPYARPMTFADKSLLFFLLTASMVAALTGMRIMSRKVLGSLQEIATMLDHPEDYQIIEREVLVMFRSPWQFFVGFMLYGLFFVMSQNQLFSSHLIVGLIILLISPIHWMMIGSLLFTRVLCDIQHLSINPLSPLKTWGLQKWFAVIGTFATTGSIVITVAATIPIILNWDNLAAKDLFWMVSMLPLLLAYWVYPYFKIRDLVRDLKLERMHRVKTHISRAYDNWQALALAPAESAEDERARLKGMEMQIGQIDRYHNLFKVIDQSPEFFVDIYSIFELGKVMGIPSFFALVTGLIRFF